MPRKKNINRVQVVAKHPAGQFEEDALSMPKILRKFNEMRKTTGFPKPLFAEMHITNRCNIECYFCNQAKLRMHNPVELPYNKIIKALSEMKDMGLSSVMFSGGGEPTLHRSFPDIIKYLSDNEITLLQVITNGMIADKDVLDAMFSARWQSVTFSLNACDANDWSSMTRGPSRGFEKILDNIRYILSKRDSEGLSYPRVMVKFGIDARTWKKLTDAYKLACELGVDDLVITTYNHITYPDYFRTNIDTILKQMRDIYAENQVTGGVKTVGSYLSDLDACNDVVREAIGEFYFDNGPPVCFMPWYGTMIAASGDVRPCASGMESLPSMGNIHKESIRAIWHGKKYQALRDMFEQACFEKNKSACAGTCEAPPDFCNPPSNEAPRCPHMVCWREFIYDYTKVDKLR